MCTQLEEQLADLNTECESLRSQLNHSKDEIEIHKSENLALKETNEDLTNQNNLLSEQFQQLAAQLKNFQDINSKFDQLTAQNVILNKNVKDFEQNIKHYKAANQQLTQQLEEYKVKVSQNESSNENKKVIIDTHKETQIKQSIKIEELEDTIQSLEAELSQPFAHCEEEDIKQHISSPPPGPLPSLTNKRTLQIKSSENIAQYAVSPNAYTVLQTNTTRSPTPNEYNDKFLQVVNYTSTTSVNDGIMVGYDIAILLQQKENEYKQLLAQNQKNEQEIKRLKERNDNSSLRNDYFLLKHENKKLKTELKKTKGYFCSSGCFSSSWFD